MENPLLTSQVGTKRARTRIALLDAALLVIEEKGFAAASLDEIAARAGMTKGATYSNFGSKAHLMLAAARAHAPAFVPAYEVGAPLRVQLKLVARAVWEMLPGIQKMAQRQAQFQLYLKDEPALRDQIAVELAAELKALIAMVSEHHSEELWVTPEALVMTLQAISLGFAHQSIATPELVKESTIRSAFDLVTRGAVRGESTAPVRRTPKRS
jgi:AcrR family transcriptional regulator